MVSVLTSWRARAATVLALVAVVLLAAAPSAWAFGHQPPGGGGNPTPPPSDQSGGSSGGNAQTTTQNCSVYATPTDIGLSCIGGGEGDITTVKDLLHGDPVPTCWDDPISDSDLQHIYGYEKVDGVTYYLHSCITGLDVNRSLFYQPDLNLSQSVIEIPDPAARCPRPFTTDQVGKCVQWLTAHQHDVVSHVITAGAEIPGVVIAERPSPKVRTDQPTAFVDTNRLLDTPVRQIGGVRVWAVLDDQYIEPNGAGVAPRKQCRLTADVQADDTPDTAPDACWWSYPQSSAGQPGKVYPFRASVHWTVYYADRAGTHVLAQFVKYSQLQLPVYDVQELVTD
ncbi:MAG: hypothetical protein ACTHMS_01940 [Jatrophihabitans sp.]|uniref:hypothetical protein n=1 Tax=Jatrophihabitans sp. TaxID=1932789 RepID=UPI003F7D921B